MEASSRSIPGYKVIICGTRFIRAETDRNTDYAATNIIVAHIIVVRTRTYGDRRAPSNGLRNSIS